MLVVLDGSPNFDATRQTQLPVFFPLDGRLHSFITEGDVRVLEGRMVLKALQVQTGSESDTCAWWPAHQCLAWA